MTIAIWKKTFIRPNDFEYSNRYGEGNIYQGRSRESLDELYKAQQIDGIVLERDWECSVVSCAQGIAQITLAPGNRFIRDMLFNERNHTIWERSEKS